MDPSPTGFYRVIQKVSDVNISFAAYAYKQLSRLPFLFSLASPSAVAYVARAQTCAHSGIEPSNLVKGFLQCGPKVRQKFEVLTISSLYVPYNHLSNR